MLLEDRLRQLSVGAEKDKMFSQLNVLKDQAESKLNTVLAHFPHFSKHDISHSQTIATHIGNLLGEDRVNTLSYSDLYMMLLSFYYHDIGMALEYEEIYSYFHAPAFQDTLNKHIRDPQSNLHQVACRLRAFNAEDPQNYETAIEVYNDVILVVEETYRSDHAKRSADEVMKNDFLREVLHERCQRILADICAVHQKSISAIADLQVRENGFFGDYFHPRLVGAMLCLGDLLDLDTDRFDEIALRSSSPMPPLSELHLAKHRSVRHFLVDKGCIEICADMSQIDTYRVMRKWVSWIQETCDYLALHWSEIAPVNFGNAPRVSKCELLLNGNTKWLEFSDMRYEVSDKRMFELLKGCGIYKNKFVCIREIIQNAVDATLLRLFDEETLCGDSDSVLQQITRIHWEDYKISGEINVLNDTQIQVRLRDRGTGISTTDIKKIAHVSSDVSARREELIHKMPVWLRPSGAFGMGLQSIFLLSNQFEVITKTSDEAAKKIVFQSASDSDGYITVEDYKGRFQQGTEISFIIEGEKLSASELGCSSYHYRQKKLNMYMLNKIYSDYTNQSMDRYPFYLLRRKTADYVPVEINYNAPGGENLLLLYDPLFVSGKLNRVEVDYGAVEIELFTSELNCFITSRIQLTRPCRNTDGCSYGELRSIELYPYQNTLFYRNNFVQDHMVRSLHTTKLPVISYMSWRINLLDAASDEVLQIGRNSINEDYADTFQQKLNDALTCAAKTAIDYMIDKSLDEEQEKLGDTGLALYQLAIQVGHRGDDFFEKFQHPLSQISINHYYRWPCGEKSEEVCRKVGDLRNTHLYFIVGKVEHFPADAPVQALQSDICLDLMGKHSVHLLSHRIVRIFLGKVNDDFVKAIEAVPFECNTPECLYQIDNLFFLENLVRMIGLHLRVLPATRGYESLITPISPSVDELKYSLVDKQYYIEMPFGMCIDSMQETLCCVGWISDAVGQYEKLILESELFHENIAYIANIRKEEQLSAIQDKYKQLIHQCLELLSCERYSEFNRTVLETAKKRNPIALENMIQSVTILISHLEMYGYNTSGLAHFQLFDIRYVDSLVICHSSKSNTSKSWPLKECKASEDPILLPYN